MGFKKLSTLGTLLIGASVLLSGCASGPKYFDNNQLASNKEAMVKEFTDSDGSRHIRKVSGKKVIIPTFQVEFLVKTGGAADSYDAMSKNRSSASASYTMQGVSAKTMQDITDQMYAKFVKDLTAAGYTVVPQSELAKSDFYKKLAAKFDKKSPFKDSSLLGGNDESLFFAASGQPMYFSMDDGKGGLGNVFSQAGSGLGGESIMDLEGELMHALDAALVRPRLVVGFASVSESGGTTSSSVSARMGVAVASKESKITFYPETYKIIGRDKYQVDSNRGSVFLKKPILAGDNVVNEVANVTSTGTQVGMVALNALSLLSGGGSYAHKDFEARMNEAAYREAALKHLNAASEMLVFKAKSE
ncbi:MAG: hypothetical protein AB1722_00180 [Pseudomonadota bacterium]